VAAVAVVAGVVEEAGSTLDCVVVGRALLKPPPMRPPLRPPDFLQRAPEAAEADREGAAEASRGQGGEAREPAHRLQTAERARLRPGAANAADAGCVSAWVTNLEAASASKGAPKSRQKMVAIARNTLLTLRDHPSPKPIAAAPCARRRSAERGSGLSRASATAPTPRGRVRAASATPQRRSGPQHDMEARGVAH